MKAAEIYQLEPIEESYELYPIRRWFSNETSSLPDDANKRIKICVLVNNCFDGRRGWYMAVIRLDNKPFMIVQGAGRENDDHLGCFITDRSLYIQSETYLASLLPEDEVDTGGKTIIDENADVPELTSFYNADLSDYYDVAFTARFKVGDVVLAKITRNHLSYGADFVLARVRITNVKPHDKTMTYHGMQCDRRWADDWKPGTPGKMIVDPGKGCIGATFSDASVMRLSTDDDDPVSLETTSFKRCDSDE